MLYRHYRNKRVYEIITEVWNTKDQCMNIIYGDVESGAVYTQPKERFFERVYYDDCGNGPRFIKISNTVPPDTLKALTLRVLNEVAKLAGFTEQINDLQYASSEKILTLLGIDFRTHIGERVVVDINKTIEEHFEQNVQKFQESISTPMVNRDEKHG